MAARGAGGKVGAWGGAGAHRAASGFPSRGSSRGGVCAEARERRGKAELGGMRRAGKGAGAGEAEAGRRGEPRGGGVREGWESRAGTRAGRVLPRLCQLLSEATAGARGRRPGLRSAAAFGSPHVRQRKMLRAPRTGSPPSPASSQAPRLRTSIRRLAESVARGAVPAGPRRRLDFEPAATGAPAPGRGKRGLRA